MADEWLKRWDDRFREPDYAYGELPNEYLKAQLEKQFPGTILFGAEGEGRNAVYAARQGWDVTAFDISQEGKNKAGQLAQKHNVTLDYRVGELSTLNFQPQQFDALALIYAHFPPEIRSAYHRTLSEYVKPGGWIILEAFGKNHLEYRAANPAVGGPGELAHLFDVEEIAADFSTFEVVALSEEVVELKEGLYHNGKGSVVRLIGKKK